MHFYDPHFVRAARRRCRRSAPRAWTSTTARSASPTCTSGRLLDDCARGPVGQDGHRGHRRSRRGLRRARRDGARLSPLRRADQGAVHRARPGAAAAPVHATPAGHVDILPDARQPRARATPSRSFIGRSSVSTSLGPPAPRHRQAGGLSGGDVGAREEARTLLTRPPATSSGMRPPATPPSATTGRSDSTEGRDIWDVAGDPLCVALSGRPQADGRWPGLSAGRRGQDGGRRDAGRAGWPPRRRTCSTPAPRRSAIVVRGYDLVRRRDAPGRFGRSDRPLRRQAASCRKVWRLFSLIWRARPGGSRNLDTRARGRVDAARALASRPADRLTAFRSPSLSARPLASTRFTSALFSRPPAPPGDAAGAERRSWTRLRLSS